MLNMMSFMLHFSSKFEFSEPLNSSMHYKQIICTVEMKRELFQTIILHRAQ
jgi:hypothetical protein